MFTWTSSRRKAMSTSSVPASPPRPLRSIRFMVAGLPVSPGREAGEGGVLDWGVWGEGREWEWGRDGREIGRLCGRF